MYQLVKKDIGGRDFYWVNRKRNTKSRAQVLCEFKYRKDAVRVLHEVASTLKFRITYSSDGKFYSKAAIESLNTSCQKRCSVCDLK